MGLKDAVDWKTQVVMSGRAGYGKTFYIQQQCGHQRLVYLPLCGTVSPSSLLSRLKHADLADRQFLLIQLHNVKNKRVLDELLFQLVSFRSIAH